MAHLIYHIAPFRASDAWQRNWAQIRKYMNVFDGGARIVAIATGDRMMPSEFVRELINDPGITFIDVPNSEHLRENASWPALMYALGRSGADLQQPAFYAHAKGATRSSHTDIVASMYWRNAMYHNLLGNAASCIDILNTFKMVGCYREKTRGYPDRLTVSGGWHFAGTFWWFHPMDVLSRWPGVWQASGYGLEALPSRMYDWKQVACPFGDGLTKLYDPNNHPLKIEDDEVIDWWSK